MARPLRPSFSSLKFKASRLWIDKKVDVFAHAEQLPLGLSRQITAENGILLEDTLAAIKTGSKSIYQPVYQMDENYNICYDDDGNKIEISTLYVGEDVSWKEKAYPLCLPYDVALPKNCTLYQPTHVYDVAGKTTALFERVRENFVEAFRPYYLVVRCDSVPLGTKAQVVCPAISSKAVRVGGYTYEGSMNRIGNISARDNNIYMFTDDGWKLVKATSDLTYEVKPFTAYFAAANGGAAATEIAIELEDNNPVISVGDFNFAINTENEQNITATLVGYHGRGGNAVVPASAPYVSFGIEKPVPVVALGKNIFADCTAELWSIDLSKCTAIAPVSIDRNAQGNPFYKVDERTIIYMPEDKAQPGKNIVVGTRCTDLTITDAWDFKPPYAFHAAVAEYSRILRASKQKDGSYKSYASTLCLPFTMTSDEVDEALGTQGAAEIHSMQYVSNAANEHTFAFTDHLNFINRSIKAGEPYLVLMKKGQLQIRAKDTEVIAAPREAEEEDVFEIDGYEIGWWKGTFAKLSNETSADINAYTLNSGKWCRIRSDGSNYRKAWVGAFRAYFKPKAPMAYNTYATYYIAEPQGDEDTEYNLFPADEYATEADFSGYEDDIDTGITLTTQRPSLNAETWFTLDGRRLNEVPTAPGIYVVGGKKVIIK